MLSCCVMVERRDGGTSDGARGARGRSDEGPALHDLDDEVLARRERLVAVRGAALRAAQVQVAVQPQPELAAAGETIADRISTTIRCSDTSLLS